MRPLPERFANCPGCGAPYTDKPELTGDLGKDLEMLIKHDEAIGVAPPKDDDPCPIDSGTMVPWGRGKPSIAGNDFDAEQSRMMFAWLYRENERRKAEAAALDARIVGLATRVTNLESWRAYHSRIGT